MVDWLPELANPQSRLRVLVIDDDPYCLQLFVDALEFENYHVTALPSGRRAREIISRWMPDLVICDLLLHGVPGGLGLIDDLLTDPTTAHIPVILCSAAIELVYSELPRLQRRNVSVLIKPFELHALSATVAAAIPLPRLHSREYGGA